MLNTDWATVGIIFTVLSAVATLTWWLSGQFAAVKNLVFTHVEKNHRILLNKLEYHERHDDDRFGQIRNDLAEIRIRNAAKDAIMKAILEKLDKREH